MTHAHTGFRTCNRRRIWGVLSCGCGGSGQELVEYRARYYLGPGQAPPPILALGLSSRKNLCIHPNVAGARRPHSDTARTLGARTAAGQQLAEESVPSKVPLVAPFAGL